MCVVPKTKIKRGWKTVFSCNPRKGKMFGSGWNERYAHILKSARSKTFKRWSISRSSLLDVIKCTDLFFTGLKCFCTIQLKKIKVSSKKYIVYFIICFFGKKLKRKRRERKISKGCQNQKQWYSERVQEGTNNNTDAKMASLFWGILCHTSFQAIIKMVLGFLKLMK